MNTKSYSELCRFQTYEERLAYLQLNAKIGDETFGFDRYLNQSFYSSYEWKRFRREMVVRDQGRDMALEGYDISGVIVLHHINPIVASDILDVTEKLMNPENVVCVSYDTHSRIHYPRNEQSIPNGERTLFDTCPWRK